jgi:hypothetical protein
MCVFSEINRFAIVGTAARESPLAAVVFEG